ncbi:MAG: hypothetical protein HY748_06985 [Elusimicrobia bacterium]|nr:hypothetical protein [Elusimicrobiota bacterium]
MTDFIKKVLKEGIDNDIGNNARALGFEGNPPTKAVGKDEEETSDNLARSFDVLIEKLPDNGGIRPVSLVLIASKQTSSALQGELFRLKPDGTLEKAIRTMGKLDEKGDGIPGSAVNVDLDPDEAQRLLKRELDFWLKGKGLKKKPAAEVAKKDAAEAKTEASAKLETAPKIEALARPEGK